MGVASIRISLEACFKRWVRAATSGLGTQPTTTKVWRSWPKRAIASAIIRLTWTSHDNLCNSFWWVSANFPRVPSSSAIFCLEASIVFRILSVIWAGVPSNSSGRVIGLRYALFTARSMISELLRAHNSHTRFLGIFTQRKECMRHPGQAGLEPADVLSRDDSQHRIQITGFAQRAHIGIRLGNRL